MSLHKLLDHSERAGLVVRWLAVFAFSACPLSVAWAETIKFSADMTASAEISPNDLKGKGRCDAALDTASNVLTWACTYSGLSGPPIGADFDGPISYSGATTDASASIQVGTAGSLASPFRGSSKIDAKQAEELRLGRWWFDLHTKKFPAGEIRGAVVRQ